MPSISKSDQDEFTWIYNLESLKGKLVKPVYSATTSSSTFTGNYEDDLKANISFRYVDRVEENTINKSSYTLVNEIGRIMDENNLSEFPIQDLDSLKKLLLAGSIINDSANKLPTTLDAINNRVDDFNQIQEETFDVNEGEDLPPIGNDSMPIPDISLTPDQTSPFPNPSTSIDTPTPQVNQPLSESCDDVNWYCGRECACPATRTLFENTYPGQDAASIWRNERSTACGGTCSGLCMKSPTMAPGWPNCN